MAAMGRECVKTQSRYKDLPKNYLSGAEIEV